MIARRNETVVASVRQRLLSGDTVLEQRTVVRVPEEVKKKMNPVFLRFSSRTVMKPRQHLVTDRSYFHLTKPQFGDSRKDAHDQRECAGGLGGFHALGQRAQLARRAAHLAETRALVRE